MHKHVIELTKYCETECVIECCGLDACDFSHIHIASYCLAWHRRKPSEILIEITNELETLRANYGSRGASGRGITINEINERLSAERVDKLVETLLTQSSAAQNLLKSNEPDGREPKFVKF